MRLKNFLTVGLFLFLMLLILTGCSQEKVSLNDKAKSEIEYLGTKFVNILNRLNNITFENYQVTTEKVELSKESAESEKSSESSSSQSSSEEPAEVKSSGGNGSSDNTIIASQMSPNTILNPVTTEIDWAGLKNEIENVYYSWNTVLLDLNKLDVSNDDILGFSNDLDKTTTYIKSEDKTNSILAVANLYGYLPKYAETISNSSTYMNVMKTKTFILNAYALIEADDWNGAKGEIDKALETFKLVTTDANFVSENSHRVNKSYVLLNELRNSLPSQDKDIFYIQYRNLMEVINEL